MVLERKLCENIPLHVEELNCEEGVYELEYQVGEEAWGNMRSKCQFYNQI
jgi:hypothetical protein